MECETPVGRLNTTLTHSRMFEKSELDLTMLDIKLMAGISQLQDSSQETTDRLEEPAQQVVLIIPS